MFYWTFLSIKHLKTLPCVNLFVSLVGTFLSNKDADSSSCLDLLLSRSAEELGLHDRRLLRQMTLAKDLVVSLEKQFTGFTDGIIIFTDVLIFYATDITEEKTHHHWRILLAFQQNESRTYSSSKQTTINHLFHCCGKPSYNTLSVWYICFWAGNGTTYVNICIVGLLLR